MFLNKLLLFPIIFIMYIDFESMLLKAPNKNADQTA